MSDTKNYFSVEVDSELLDRTTLPYRSKGAIYLQSATVTKLDSGLEVEGNHRIVESAYIDDTGHFNAAEFIISYNQMVYVGLATAIRDQIIPALAGWSMDDYWERQLPDVLITKMNTRFRSAIDPRDYHARLTISEFEYRNRRQPVLLFDTEVRFWDGGGGEASGDGQIALKNLPLGIDYEAICARDEMHVAQ